MFRGLLVRCAEWAMQGAHTAATMLVALSFAEGCVCADCMSACP